MIKNVFLLLGLLLACNNVSVAQDKYFSRDGKVTFFSDAPMEKIDGINKKATSVIDTETGKIEVMILMKAFEFEKALMQEHFNENYVESDKYPKAVFKGEIDNKQDVKWSVDGNYPVKLSGTMTMHGETKDLVTEALIKISGGKVNGNSEFNISLSDYKIGIPKVVKDKVSEIVNIKVDIDYELLKK